MYGKIDKIWHNQRADGTEYWVLTINGHRYSTWDPEHVSYAQEGEFVEFSYTNNGSYRNLLAIRRVDDPAPEQPGQAAPDSVALQGLRVSSLQIATELLKGTRMNPEQRLNLAIDIARKIENHIWLPPCSRSDKQPENKPGRVDVTNKRPEEGGA